MIYDTLPSAARPQSLVRVADLARYLNRQGWHRAGHPNERLLVFEKSIGGDRVRKLVFASHDEYSDSARLIENALEVLAEEQGVALDQLARSVHSVDRDILTVRLMSVQASSGGLPLDVAAKLIFQLRDFLAYAACVEQSPQAYFPKATAIGRQYAEKCRFGHTFPGSFGFTIESPTGIAPLARPDDTPAPFERRVMDRIVRGLRDLEEAVLSGEVDAITSRYEQGLNANLCEVLEATLKHAEDAELEYAVAWSPEWPVAADLRGVRSVRLEQRSAGFLGAAARQLRDLKESKSQTIRGQVVELRSEESSSEDMATVLWSEEGRRLRVRVALALDDYQLACDAHKSRLTVSVTGRLEKVGKFWTLMAPADFQIDG